MRVIAGSARGLRLAAPKIHERDRSATRSRSLCSGSSGAAVGARVLDLYAGSGAIGIEALSRGASHATFVERGRPAVAVIRENLERTSLTDRAEIHAASVETFLERTVEDPWDVAVLDPPYAERTLGLPLEELRPHLRPGRWSWSSTSGAQLCSRPATWWSPAAGDSAKRH